jgi:putative membrane protein
MKRLATFCALAMLLLVWQANPAPAASPADFLGQAMDCNTYMKDLAEQAAQNATNEDVKGFARGLAAEHKKMEGDLLQLIKDKKVGVATGTSKEHNDRIADLKKTPKGADYDKKFLQFVIEEHEKVAKHLEECAKDGSLDGDCKACAQKNLPTVKKHLEEARAHLKKVGG